MNGLNEIREANRGTPEKAKADPRVQRDRLAQCLRRVLANDTGAADTARKVLTEIYGK